VCGLSLTRVLYKSARDGHENARVASVSIVNVAMGARVVVNSLGGNKSSGPQQILAARCNDNRAALPAYSPRLFHAAAIAAILLYPTSCRVLLLLLSRRHYTCNIHSLAHVCTYKYTLPRVHSSRKETAHENMADSTR
jgi:hypothetical protein